METSKSLFPSFTRFMVVGESDLSSWALGSATPLADTPRSQEAARWRIGRAMMAAAAAAAAAGPAVVGGGAALRRFTCCSRPHQPAQQQNC